MNGRQIIKLCISIVIAILAITALCCVTILNIFGSTGNAEFDVVDVGGSIVAIVGVYKYEPKGGVK